VVVRVPAQDREPAVQLLEQDHPDQPVGQGDPPERDEAGGPLAQGVGVAVGPADRQGQRAAAAVLLLAADERGQVFAGDEVTPLIERDDQRAVR